MNDGWTIKDRFDHEIDAVIDSGACGTVPTTVVDLTQGYPEVVRVGAGDPSPFVSRVDDTSSRWSVMPS
jgi:tRNA A37 threonylcarbamoyladenosine synthetase subunit TsaC/SUA5/YrdC